LFSIKTFSAVGFFLPRTHYSASTAPSNPEDNQVLGIALDGVEEAQEEFWIPNDVLLVIFREIPRVTLEKMKLVCK
jgi:hypothetical protein